MPERTTSHALAQLLSTLRPGGRFVRQGGRRLHVEVRALSERERERFAEALDRRLTGNELVAWWRHVPEFHRIVVAFHDSNVPTDLVEQLLRMVDEVEREVGVEERHFGGDRLRQPGSEAAVARHTIALGLSGLAFGIAALGRSPGRGRHDLGVAATLASGVPALRRALSDTLGPSAAEIGIDLLGATARIVNRSTVSSASGVLVQTAQLEEARQLDPAWERWEPRLFAVPPETSRAASRPPTPAGPVERYVGRATLLASSAFLLSLALNRPLRAASTFLYAGLPLPARVGTRTFASGLRRRLMEDGGLILSPDRLALLDRVDRVVLDARLLPPEAEVLSSIDLATGAVELDEELVEAEAARRLLGIQSTKLPGLELRRSATGQHGNIYDLSLNGSFIGTAVSETIESPSVESVCRAARHSSVELDVVGVTEDIQGVQTSTVVEVASTGAISEHVRDARERGETVLYIGLGPDAAFAEADVAIGCWRGGGHPWIGADAMVEARPGAIVFLIRAIGVARSVSRRAIGVAQAEASVGMVLGRVLPTESGFSRVFFARHFATVGAFVDAVMAVRDLRGDDERPDSRAQAWQAMPVDETLDRLDSRRAGLEGHEVEARRRPASKETVGGRSGWTGAFVDELRTPMTPILAAASGLSATFSSSADALLVALVLGFDAAWGATQRRVAEQRINELVDREDRSVRVRRSGQVERLQPEELVPGDVVMLEVGDVVPADVRVIEGRGIEADESALTGEASPVEKSAEAVTGSLASEQRSLLFQGTSVASGRAEGVVVGVGRDTRASRLAAASSQWRQDRRQTADRAAARLERVARLTLPVAAATASGVVLSGLARGKRPATVLRSAISVGVAAVPEGLTLLPTVAGLAGSARLAGEEVRVRDHLAPERIGRASVVCIDKTGTLTKSGMDLVEWTTPSDARAQRREHVARWIALASVDEEGRTCNELDAAAAEWVARTLNIDLDGIPRPHELQPFDARRRYQCGRSGREVVLKGAPESLLKRCDLSPEEREMWLAASNAVAARGLKALVVCVGESEPSRTEGSLETEQVEGLRPVSIIGFRTRLRDGAETLISQLEELGVRAVMLTGDHLATAEAMGDRLRLPGAGFVTGSQLRSADAESIVEWVHAGQHFARVTPEQKARVVEVLQAEGHTVAMVGDGINDAAALRLADVGVVVGQDKQTAAVEAADVLVGQDLGQVVDLVREGRRVGAALEDATSVLVGGNLGELAFVGVSGVVRGQSPLSARQLVLVNLLTDALPALTIAARATTSSPRDDGASHDGPQHDERESLEALVAWRAMITATSALGAHAVARRLMPRRRASTVALLALVGAQMAQTIASSRGDRRVVLTGLGSLAALVALVQTPGVSRLADSRPVGPVGLGIAAGATIAAAIGDAASRRLPPEIRETPARLIEQLEDRATEATSVVSGAASSWLDRGRSALDRLYRKVRRFEASGLGSSSTEDDGQRLQTDASAENCEGNRPGEAEGDARTTESSQAA